MNFTSASSGPATPGQRRTAPNPQATAEVRQLPLSWIRRLRYGVITGEAALSLSFSLVFGIVLPWRLLVAMIVAQALTNWLMGRYERHTSRNTERVVGALFCLDTVCLTLILALTGGPMNPFSLLYLVQITFSAILLHRVWTWTLGVLSTISFGLLFWVSRDVPALQQHFRSGEFSLHLLGMWISFATAALLISFFVGKVSAEAREKEKELLVMQQRLARNERMASLVTLSAGAAHEIATPLATIAVAATEIERAAATETLRSLQEDAQLIRSQVERCRLILERMGAQGADPLGEVPRSVSLRDLLSDVRERFPDDRSRIHFDLHGTEAWCLPRRASVEAISALVKNALDASPDTGSVQVTATVAPSRLRLTVRDEGEGMKPEVLERVSEPFFTTKQPGKGMGLGAFLVHLFAQSLGGELSYSSRPGHGCTAILDLPPLSRVETTR